MSANHASQHRPTLRTTVLLGGGIAGLLDGLDAILFFGLVAGIPAGRIFQGIASGLLGRSAYAGGAKTILLGVLLHFTVAFGAALVFYAVASLYPKLLASPYLFGGLFGLVVFFVMYQVVVPLSRMLPRKSPMGAVEFVNELFAHICLVGLPIAIAAARSARTPTLAAAPNLPLIKSRT